MSESDSRLLGTKLNLAAHVGSCMLPSGRDGDTVYVVKTVSVFTVYLDDALSCAHCARGLCMLCMCVVQATVVVLLSIIVSFGTSF